MLRPRFIFPFRPICALMVLAAGFASGVERVAARTLTPLVSASIRTVANRTVEQSEPFVVNVRLAVPPDVPTSFLLAPAAGDWTSAVIVELAKDKDAPPLARAAVVGRPASPTITLQPKRSAGGLWQFSSDAVKGIAPGDYVVRVRLKIDRGTGWTGDVLATLTKLNIVAPSSDPRRAAQSTLGRAQEKLLAGDDEAAAKLIDGLLTKSPKHREALLLRAVLAEKAGNLVAALLCVNLASHGLAPGAPPPADLYDLQTRLQAKMFTAGSPAPSVYSPPAWSWPPRELFADLERAALTAAAVPVTSPIPANDARRQPASPAAVPPRAPAQLTMDSPAAPSGTAKHGEPDAGIIVSATELTDARIVPDAAGQWASAARAGSQYGSSGYSPAKATGAPDVTVAGDSVQAWCPAVKSNGLDWIELSFANPLQAVELRVRQNNEPGAIVKIEALEPDGTAHVWWEGVDSYVAPAVRDIAWFAVRVSKTRYLVAKVKVTLNLAASPGWKQIDAVQLVGER